MLEEVERWLSARSWSVGDRPIQQLMAAKHATGQSVSVVLPALDEEATVGGIVSVIRRELMLRVPLVDELVVVDSGSRDRTSAVAARRAPVSCTATRSSPAYPPCRARARCCGARCW